MAAAMAGYRGQQVHLRLQLRRLYLAVDDRVLAKHENLARGRDHESRGHGAGLLARWAHAMRHDGMGAAVGDAVAIDVQMAVCASSIGHGRIANRGWGHFDKGDEWWSLGDVGEGCKGDCKESLEQQSAESVGVSGARLRPVTCGDLGRASVPSKPSRDRQCWCSSRLSMTLAMLAGQRKGETGDDGEKKKAVM